MYKLYYKLLDAKDWLQGKKTYLAAFVAFVASLKGLHIHSLLDFLNSSKGLHAELAVLASTLRASIGRRS